MLSLSLLVKFGTFALATGQDNCPVPLLKAPHGFLKPRFQLATILQSQFQRSTDWVIRAPKDQSVVDHFKEQQENDTLLIQYDTILCHND